MGSGQYLKDFSTEELEKELALRKIAKPERLPLPNWVDVADYVQGAVNLLAAGKGLPKDFEHWLFQVVMEAMYGQDVWKWWNRHFQ